jgi:dihydrofolate synthase / folylpolyglutamate synthase
MATYQETLKTLFELKSNRVSNRVEDVRIICEAFGNPQSGYRIVHVTGTNGKGTVSKQTAAILTKQGYKTGLITSPHIIEFRERISINFELIPEDYVIYSYQLILSKFAEKDLSCSFEQVVFIMGLLYFRDNQIEYAVIEVGCGGTRDSSNIVDPVVSIITSVGLDHTHLLGNTVEEIALEKSGVIKPGRPCVFGPNTPQQLLIGIAREKGAPFHLVEKSDDDQSYIEENSRITRKVFEIIEVSEEAIQLGLKYRQPFRCKRIEFKDLVLILDVGHNPMALTRVFSDIKRGNSKSIRTLITVSIGRNPIEFVRIASESSSNVHVISSSHFRIKPFSEVVSLATSSGFQLQESGDVSDIIPLVIDKAKDEIILIIGSCFIMESVVQVLQSLGIPIDPYDHN